MKIFDLVIGGAGAAGLIASIHAAELGMSVLVIEKMSVPGKKLLITGKGRCNITNDAEIKDFLNEVYPDGRFLYPAFRSFFSSEMLDLLSECGVETMLERGGRYFPASEKAYDVVDALYKRAVEYGVEFIFDSIITKVMYENESVVGVEFKQNHKTISISTNKFIVCTGGKSYPGTGSTGDGYKIAKDAGHTIQKTFPSLVPLVTKNQQAIQMQGLALKNINVNLYIDNQHIVSEFGDLLFTHFGLSGPVILTISRNVVLALEENRKVVILIDFKPALDNDKLDKRLLRDINEFGKKKIGNLFRQWLPQKAIQVFINELNIDSEKPANQISGTERDSIVQLMKNFNFEIENHRGFKEAIITAGGVSLNEINPKTMESKIKSGLYFAGEILDLDANTGGYNLQIAFSTGWLAAN
jgi:predicted Rossmann fold flavoprotein